MLGSNNAGTFGDMFQSLPPYVINKILLDMMMMGTSLGDVFSEVSES
jgi:hypothetical protein